MHAFKFTIVCALAAIIIPHGAHALDQIIVVSGEASVSVAPNIAVVNAGVTTQAKSAREATDSNSVRMKAVLDALKQINIPDRDIQTSRLSIQPMYEPNRGQGGTITGFQTSNQVTIRLHDPGQVSAVIDRVVTAGANNIGGIDFRVSDPGKAIDKVRGDAIKDARRKAELYAEAAGRKLGRVVTVTEGGGGGYRPPLPMARAGAAVPVMSGEETLSVAVTVTFELQP